MYQVHLRIKATLQVAEPETKSPGKSVPAKARNEWMPADFNHGTNESELPENLIMFSQVTSASPRVCSACQFGFFLLFYDLRRRVNLDSGKLHLTVQRTHSIMEYLYLRQVQEQEKTYALARIVLRLIAEHGVEISRILVVTFTTAATEELRSRIRELVHFTLKSLQENDTNITDETILQLSQTEQKRFESIRRIQVGYNMF